MKSWEGLETKEKTKGEWEWQTRGEGGNLRDFCVESWVDHLDKKIYVPAAAAAVAAVAVGNGRDRCSEWMTMKWEKGWGKGRDGMSWEKGCNW